MGWLGIKKIGSMDDHSGCDNGNMMAAQNGSWSSNISVFGIFLLCLKLFQNLLMWLPLSRDEIRTKAITNRADKLLQENDQQDAVIRGKSCRRNESLGQGTEHHITEHTTARHCTEYRTGSERIPRKDGSRSKRGEEGRCRTTESLGTQGLSVG